MEAVTLPKPVFVVGLVTPLSTFSLLFDLSVIPSEGFLAMLMLGNYKVRKAGGQRKRAKDSKHVKLSKHSEPSKRSKHTERSKHDSQDVRRLHLATSSQHDNLPTTKSRVFKVT